MAGYANKYFKNDVIANISQNTKNKSRGEIFEQIDFLYTSETIHKR